jgi:Spy/CpxP family protein refolding chaperone
MKGKYMKRIMRIAYVIIFFLAISTQLYAMDCSCGREPMRGGAIQHHQREAVGGLFNHLDLTSEQKAKIEALRLSFIKDIKPLQDQMFSERGDIRLLWMQPTPDKAKISSLRKDMRNINDQIEDRATGLRVDVFNTLTPEQKSKAKAFFFVHGFGPGMR